MTELMQGHHKQTYWVSNRIPTNEETDNIH